LPANIELSKVVVSNGKLNLVDSYKNPIPEGHFQFLKEKKHYLLPFPHDMKSIEIPTAEEKAAAAARFESWRQGLVDRYMAEFFPEASSPPDTVQLMKKGDAAVLSRFNSDSHSKNATNRMPPTPSMPSATMDPSHFFKS